MRRCPRESEGLFVYGGAHTEISLATMAYNLKRMVDILGAPRRQGTRPRMSRITFHKNQEPSLAGALFYFGQPQFRNSLHKAFSFVFSDTLKT
jgi:hypothetical protein